MSLLTRDIVIFFIYIFQTTHWHLVSTSLINNGHYPVVKKNSSNVGGHSGFSDIDIVEVHYGTMQIRFTVKVLSNSQSTCSSKWGGDSPPENLSNRSSGPNIKFVNEFLWTIWLWIAILLTHLANLNEILNAPPRQRIDRQSWTFLPRPEEFHTFPFEPELKRAANPGLYGWVFVLVLAADVVVELC